MHLSKTDGTVESNLFLNKCITEVKGISSKKNYQLTILRTVLMKVLETLFVPLAFTLTLNPSPKRGEGLQSGSPFGRRGWGMRADYL